MHNTQELIHAFTEAGHKVIIRHHRVLRDIGVVEFHQREVVVDQVLTRGEFERAAAKKQLDFDEMGRYFYPENTNPNDIKFGSVVSPRGGFTEAIIVENDGTEFRGKYNFGNRPFFRKKGAHAALQRAINEFNKERNDV